MFESLNLSTILGLFGTYPYHTLAALCLGFILFTQLNIGRNGNPNGLPLPPGPKGFPLIGNLFDMPVEKAWVVYDEWRKTYGKVLIINGLPWIHTNNGTSHFHFRRSDTLQCPRPEFYDSKLLGNHHRPVREKIFQLFRQNATHYVNWTVCIRYFPSQILKNAGHCRMDWGSNFGMMRYSPLWRKQRRSFHEHFHRNAAIKYQPIQQRGTKAFLRRLLVTPDDFFHHIRQ